jgi:hypothetical protein
MFIFLYLMLMYSSNRLVLDMPVRSISNLLYSSAKQRGVHARWRSWASHFFFVLIFDFPRAGVPPRVLDRLL